MATTTVGFWKTRPQWTTFPTFAVVDAGIRFIIADSERADRLNAVTEHADLFEPRQQGLTDD